jgi:hypothetical protein
VHLQNLLTDAKRDRAARVFGYVAVWLPEELLLLYLQEGEVVAATMSTDGATFTDLPIREALRLVPNAAEYGEVCFHEADDEQLACMHAAQTTAPDALPGEVRASDGTALLAHLHAATYDGMLEIQAGGGLNYVVLRHGAPRRAYFADGMRGGSLDVSLRGLWEPSASLVVRRWPIPPPLPNQASPALIDAYRGLVKGLTERLSNEGVRNAAQLVERARQAQLAAHPSLARLDLAAVPVKDPVTTAPDLTRAIAAWAKEVLWATALPETAAPETLLRDLTRERRHLFKTAGFFDALPWRIAQ